MTDWRTCLECCREHALAILVDPLTKVRTTSCKFCKDVRVIPTAPVKPPAKVAA